MPALQDPRVLVATETADDAGVYRLQDDLALVQTVDFFTPILDDPHDFGRVAAANSISDVYAMGGRPLTALSVLCFPEKDLPPEVALQIMEGARRSAGEAGVAILGGHSVSDSELKFGLAVTGTVHPDHVWRNRGARPGDVLLLTKPLGSGILSTAHKKGALSSERRKQLTEVMATLNRSAAEGLAGLDVHACTDVTGFGLAGHAAEMARASDVCLELRFVDLPLLDGTLELAETFLTRGERTNAELTADVLRGDDALTRPQRSVLLDPQTSGGLLVALSEDDAERAGERFESWRVGVVSEGPAEVRVR